MARLTESVMFREDDNPEGYTDAEITALNFELKEFLGRTVPDSPKYMERARAFHDEVARRKP